MARRIRRILFWTVAFVAFCVVGSVWDGVASGPTVAGENHEPLIADESVHTTPINPHRCDLGGCFP
jgi:hypothetical protein